MPASRPRRRTTFSALIRNAGVMASAVILGVGSAIVILATPERRTPIRVAASDVVTDVATPVAHVVTRAELPRRIPVAFSAQPEIVVSESAAA